MRTPAEVNSEASKLDRLASLWGMSVNDFVEEHVLCNAVPGICMNPDCGYAAEVKPDQRSPGAFSLKQRIDHDSMHLTLSPDKSIIFLPASSYLAEHFSIQ